MTREKPDHGTRSCYMAGCRREECIQANRDYQRGWHAWTRALKKNAT